MEVDAILSEVTRLAASLDASIERGTPCPEDDVYALVGLVLELDAWLGAGHTLPARWGSRRSVAQLVLLGADPAANDVARSRRRSLARGGRIQTQAHQLSLPFA